MDVHPHGFAIAVESLYPHRLSVIGIIRRRQTPHWRPLELANEINAERFRNDDF